MTAPKSLDELKEELANSYEHEAEDDPFVDGFTACQGLTIDRREVRKLVEALIAEIKVVKFVGYNPHI